MVADSLLNEDEAVSPTLALPVLGNHPESEVTPINQVRNSTVAQDMQLVGTFWNENNEDAVQQMMWFMMILN